ncbi:DNA glycosylase [Mycena vulgaris]|nr:DNA glycosylase [Mycena vulgaris]
MSGIKLAPGTGEYSMLAGHSGDPKIFQQDASPDLSGPDIFGFRSDVMTVTRRAVNLIRKFTMAAVNALYSSRSMGNPLKRAHSDSSSSVGGGTAAPQAPVKTTATGTVSNKKMKLQRPILSESPFPSLPRPSLLEAREVYTLLCEVHGTPRPSPATSAAPNLLEGLISNILSQSTSGPNSSRAKASLDAAFGCNNFSAIADASPDRVVEAIRCGGLAKKKGATIQKLLSAVHERHGSYSLQFLAATADGDRKTDAEVTAELVSYAGIGPKTAACFSSLCLGRESLAVDTHVWRLSKVLGWVPESADRVRTQAHLDRRLPGDLKLGLHVLMMRYGRTCTGCKKGSSGPCILKTYRRGRST